MLEAKYGLSMLPSQQRKRKSQELVESHVSNLMAQPHSPSNPMPDVEMAVDGNAPLGATLSQLAQSSTGRAMLQRAMDERGQEVQRQVLMSLDTIDG